MPNWCFNTVEIETTDQSQFVWLTDVVENATDGIFNAIVPVPEDARLDAAVQAWGTKWDVVPPGAGDGDGEIWELEIEEFDGDHGGTIRFECDTAWQPPRGVLQALFDKGFSVRCEYREPNMQLQGCWEDGHDDQWELEDDDEGEDGDECEDEDIDEDQAG